MGTERDKMLRGELYDPSDPGLVAARGQARRLLRRLTALHPDDLAERAVLLRTLLGAIGGDTWVETPFFCDYGRQIRLGDRVFVNMACVFLDAAVITLGDDVQVGPGVQLLTSDHPRDAGERAKRLETARPITIGARAWLGGNVVVLPGIEIGAGAVIGAGSVVTHSVPDGIVAAGNPCRPLHPA